VRAEVANGLRGNRRRVAVLDIPPLGSVVNGVGEDVFADDEPGVESDDGDP
jgi:hypothetical protein